MEIYFTIDERDYVVKNESSDLMLTSIGMKLIERVKPEDNKYSFEVGNEEFDGFLEILRDEYIWKINRTSDPRPLKSIAMRFLDDFNSLEPINFC